MNLKPSNTRTKVRGNLTATVRKDKHTVNILANKHSPQLQNNFCDEHGKAEKQAILQDYNRHMRYVDMSDHMTNTYSLSRQTNTLFFPSSGPYHSQQLYYACLFMFKIITPTIQIDTGEGPNTRGRQGAST